MSSWVDARRGLLLAGSLMAPATALGAPGLVARPDPQDVYGGNPVSPCEWPTTVSLGGCTGTLVHPEVVIYAAHCGSVSSIFFGDSVYAQGRTVYPEYCKTYPGGGPGYGTDWAFCKLSQPVTDIPATPPLMGCETELLQQGAEVWLVGFGNTDDGNFGVKYEAKTVFNYQQNNEAFIGGGGIDTCQGDSGGPVYIQLEDGSYRAFGITSYGNGCGGGGWYSMMHPGMEWFESESGIDLTPCHDADGTWNPGPECKGFATQAHSGSGSWPESCDFGEISGWSSTCGAPHAAGEDDTPPTVAIVAPDDGVEVTSDPATGRAQLVVQVEAEDGPGSGVREVTLVVDGQALANPDLASPFAFDINLDPGVHTLQAIAIDHADNAAESGLVTVGVDEMPPPPPDDDGVVPGGTDGGSAGGTGDEPGDPLETEGEPDNDPGGATMPGAALPSAYGLDGASTGCACRSSSGSGAFGAWALLAFMLVGRRRSG